MKFVLPTIVVLYCFSLLGELGSIWWVFDLFSHWRMIYIAGGTLVILLTLLFRQKKLAFMASVVLACHIIVVAAYVRIKPILVPLRANQSQQTITVAFANTYWKNEDMQTLVDGIKEMNADVIFLEEIQPDQFETVKSQLGEYTFAYNAPVDLAFDMAVLSKVPVKDYTTHYFLPEVPLIEVVVDSNGKDLHLLGVHPHSPVSAEFTANRNLYIDRLLEYVDTSGTSVVMGGDFNISQFSPEYRELLTDSRMIDTQRNFPLTSTWPAQFPKWAAIPIDQVFVTPDVLVTERYRGAFTGSDHWPIVVEVGL